MGGSGVESPGAWQPTDRVLLTGGSGRLGPYLVRELRQSPVVLRVWDGPTATVPSTPGAVRVDLADPEAVIRAWQAARPTVVIHSAALATVDVCLKDPARAEAVNVMATGHLARLAREAGAHLAMTSTDMVFDGSRAPYAVDANPQPLSAYGRSTAAGEQAALDTGPCSIIRLALLYGPRLGIRPSFFDTQVAALRAGGPRMGLFTDEWRTPIDYATAARAVVELAALREAGVWHVGGPERISRWELGSRLARHLGINHPPFDPVSRLSIPGPEPRPADLSLDSHVWRDRCPHSPWPTLDEVLARDLPPN
ncbi:MAG: SDR family oxidoreductase [Planctomycetaceae bacterium]